MKENKFIYPSLLQNVAKYMAGGVLNLQTSTSNRLYKIAYVHKVYQPGKLDNMFNNKYL